MAADSAVGIRPDDLLLSVAEQLKVPLTTIARQAELGQITSLQVADTEAIRTQAIAALTLVDSYLLGIELLRKQTELELEPVSLSSLLVDAAHDLERFACHYGVQLELITAGRYGPVMAHGRGVKAALLSLGFTIVEAVAAGELKSPRRVTLATHRTPHGIVTGMYGSCGSIAAGGWRSALALINRAERPGIGLGAGSGAGLFVADTILRSMHTRLRAGHYRHQSGLAATFQPSRQLQLV